MQNIIDMEFLPKPFVKQVIWDMLANVIHIMFTISYISERVLDDAIVIGNTRLSTPASGG